MHIEPIIVGFFILQYAKVVMLQLVYNSFDKFCDPTKYDSIETDTDSLNVAISEPEIEDIIREDMRELWNHYRISDCQSDFLADGQYNFFSRICYSKPFKFDQ